MADLGARWLAMSEEERAPYRELVKDFPIDPTAVAITKSILRRVDERAARKEEVA